ncbi:DUF3784 domain-containing protein [Paenibacillus mendelii]|uniref:DUF3784 domain-containing protein n=1 Tax=Paenibacillus mendelii TaxID=206163 RepID=A0ABV6J1W8_9BACL|nr:DUF3784 domain-containing protein [Paenibacillus mendelii]MCQ6562811.1 DUF3784 domain-containing protein [Paenibacillus mendelii]
MKADLLIIGGILLLLGFLIGVKKKTWLLSGFNEKRVADKNKLSVLVGGYNGIMSMLFIAAGVSSFQYVQGLIAVLIIGYVVLLIYVNVKMVE